MAVNLNRYDHDDVVRLFMMLSRLSAVLGALTEMSECGERAWQQEGERRRRALA